MNERQNHNLPKQSFQTSLKTRSPIIHSKHHSIPTLIERTLDCSTHIQNTRLHAKYRTPSQKINSQLFSSIRPSMSCDKPGKPDRPSTPPGQSLPATKRTSEEGSKRPRHPKVHRSRFSCVASNSFD
ncbi:hypothetical protein KC19_6G157500 [Ceratodon purpureus]|uniref:Uncharacterized protein n=1 Tax=Ceratodon purpureus TaxID=3225 RepID=A0A8T0HHP6_CERPU|nr:hypothetical protein KC19_6G157400 [Ceratodon purpureus]KAG0570377.1 hypothetical protein KC19_6G157500 [Ceratodon purpureus]